MKQQIHTILLTICAFCLLCVGVFSICTPIRFEREAARREKEVEEHIRMIIDAEDKYCEANGKYTENWGDLVGRGFLADSLCVIPFSNGELFTLTYSDDKDPSGQKIQTIDCSALYQQYLHDLDNRQLGAFIEESSETGRFPGVSMSHTTMLNNN